MKKLITILILFGFTYFVSIPTVFGINTYSVDLELDSTQYLTDDGDSASLSITGDMTIEAWVKVEDAPASGVQTTIAAKYKASTNERSYIFSYFNNSGTFAMYFQTSDNGSAPVPEGEVAQTLTAGTWYHAAMTYDASAGTVEFFINGNSIGSDNTVDTSLDDNTAPFMIGAIIGGGGTPAIPFDGKIDEVRVWNDIRTDSEIDDNKAIELVGNEAGLVGYWRLEQNGTDETANDNDLTEVNTPSYSTDVPFGGGAPAAVNQSYKIIEE